MPAHLLSFSEVLEDEYRYFHGELIYKQIAFEAKHVREIEDFASLLEQKRMANDRSRWTVLARHIGDSGPDQDHAAAVVAGLNALLKEESLLEQLLADPLFAKDFPDPVVSRALLRIPIARRLLLETAGIGPKLAAMQEVIDLFAARSAAIRVLLTEDWRPTFEVYPGLLSSIADDEVIDAAVAGSADVRAALAKFYRVVSPRRPSRMSFLTGRLAPVTPPRVELATDPAFLRRSLGLTVQPPPHKTTPREQLSHFNVILVEAAYSDYVCSGQTMRALYAAVNQKETAALCLSGGGIRSATFNLGVLQGLADHRMLNRFHYISTVSGGGYIGSWLSSWMRRHSEGAVGVAKDLSREPTDPLAPEVEPIRHLREYSSYLAPRATAFSLDSWTLLATYIRNLLLNWTMLVPLFAAMFIVPRLFEGYVMRALSPWDATWCGPIALIAALAAVVIIAVVRPASDLPVEKGKLWMRKAGLTPWLFFLVISAFAFCLYWAEHADTAVESDWIVPLFSIGSMVGAGVYASRVWREAAIDIPSGLKRVAQEVACAGVSGAIAGWLLLEAFSALFPLSFLQDRVALGGLTFEIYICAAVPLYLLIFFANSTLLIGLSTEFTEDYDREWWARSAAAVILFCVLHAFAAFAVLLLPVLILRLPEYTAPIGGLSGLGSWLLSRRPKKGAPGSAAGRLLMPMLRLAATITLLFLVALISIITSSMLARMNAPEAPEFADRFAASQGWSKQLDRVVSLFDPTSAPGDAMDAPTEYLYVLRETRLTTLWVFLAIAFALALLMARVLNVNIYSMHGMYRNRLIRAYLGASRWERRPDPFTGFDPQDNIEMWKLRPHCLWQSSFVDFHPFAVKLSRMSWWNDPRLSKENEETSEAVEGARAEVEDYLAPDRELSDFDERLTKERDGLVEKSEQQRRDFDTKAENERAQLASKTQEERREIEGRIESERQELETRAKQELRAFEAKAASERKELEKETLETRDDLEPETMVAVIDALNALMRCYDLAHDVEAPRTVGRVVENRAYLDEAFHPALKAFTPRSRLEEPRAKLSVPEEAGRIPKDLQHKDGVPLLRVPPLHVVNASLNLVDGDNLAWQERKAASFTVSPLHAGSRALQAYRDTAEYGEAISLGTAMAISGAAVSPNMGALSSPAFTFLMTIFNARLGWWIGNPASDETSNVPSPRWSLLSLLREALGKTDAKHPYVFLSDGGHFENLGLYEMVLRRCKYIVVCDASADGSYGFGDLANAVRKVRIDLGIPIEPLVTKYIGPQEDERYGRYCAVGEIHYKNVDGGNAMGYLVYIKPAIYSDSPADVRNYAKESTAFPHETTADQFFSESQFESYRALGRYVIGKICNDKVGEDQCVAPNVPLFFANAWNYVQSAEPPVGDQRIAKVSDVVKWMRSGLGEK